MMRGINNFHPELNYMGFPRWTAYDSKLYRFKTGWIAIKPGTDVATEKDGDSLINSKGNSCLSSMR